MKSAFFALVAVSLLTGSALAQTPAAPAAAPTVPAKAPVVRTAKSLDCSKEADAKSLHGKPRKHFMSSCKKA
ncbi:PsiF family protein [Lichenihabitans sp. Uapishka_5]|uniref:PsiF family protein n=1 Tax=Lichenihabitans sp. Uapishka_5 TaxID=3037302 RepID=UPI0029E80EA1|nr:PsiF family protein [Lichenihabitans sp. Uapishka_5]MDX7951234.1 PsiF family protein [Lichenihabitans sp. Uapishka_5]